MLRITVHDNPESITFQLEGRLVGARVTEVEECRQRALADRRQPAVRLDLAGVTFVDDAGKAYQAAMHRLGADFVATACLTKAIVAEISNAPVPYSYSRTSFVQ
jgi:ABC-type transporter Mla MlaB component